MSDAWHQWRSEGWGASDIAAAWTGRYGGAYTVVAQKAGRLPTWEADMDTGRMQRGHDLEPAIAAMVQICTGLYVVGEQTWCEHRDEPRHRATVDGFVAEFNDQALSDAIGPVEFKTHGVDVRPAWDYYEAQVQWQLYVTGFDRAVLAVATVDDSEDRIVGFRVSIIEADPLIQDGLVILARILDDHLADGTLPDPDGSPAAAEAVKAVTYTTDPPTPSSSTSPTSPTASPATARSRPPWSQRRRSRPSWRTCCVPGSAPGCVAWPARGPSPTPSPAGC